MEQTFLNKDYFDNNLPYHAGFYIEHRERNMHSHEFYEISYVYEGRGIHDIHNAATTAIQEGEFIFITPGISHCMISPPSDQGNWVRVCNLLMKQEYMDRIRKRLFFMDELNEYTLRNKFAQNTPFCLHLKDDSGCVSNLLLTAAHEYRHFTDGSDTVIENTALSLLIYITRLYERSLTGEKVTSTKNDIIDELIKYMKSNFGFRLTLDYLAAYVHLSPEYLSRYFKKCTGRNIFDYLTEIRIDRAKYMLRTSSVSINDISLYCGFRAISSFQKSFKKAVGMSAGEYRKMQK